MGKEELVVQIYADEVQTLDYTLIQCVILKKTSEMGTSE